MDSLISAQMRQWAARTMRAIAGQVRPLRQRRSRRLLLVHLDGIPRVLLERAMASQSLPFIAALVRSGTYNLDGAFWGSPASTPAFQASLLFGLRHPDVPAYEWFDRSLGRLVRMSRPRDAQAIEHRLNGGGRSNLLEGGGSAYLALFRPEGSEGLSMTSLMDKMHLAGTVGRQLTEMGADLGSSEEPILLELSREAADGAVDMLRWSWRQRNFRHEWLFFCRRIFLLSAAWRFAQWRAMADMVRGVPAIYLVFANFDEVAHRRGPFSARATRELRQVDRAVERLCALANELPNRYDVILLTDHGQVESSPLEAQFGKRLHQCLIQAAPSPVAPDLERALLDGRTLNGSTRTRAEAEPIVIEAGNFAHIYLDPLRPPLEAMDLLAHYRDVLGRATQLEQIAMVALRLRNSAVAIVQGKVYRPEEMDRSPLPNTFSKAAAADLLRELPRMSTAGDLVVYGQALNNGGTVGFAWEFGSHGGLTRSETESVVCWPKQAPLDLSALYHATELHEKLSELYRG
jgi:hypothetical protein